MSAEHNMINEDFVTFEVGVSPTFCTKVTLR